MFYDWKMGAQDSRAPRADRAAIAVRIATWVGRTVGRWQRRRVAKKDDAYVMRWKVAWSTGRDARLTGAPRDAVPHRRRAQREAWLAGCGPTRTPIHRTRTSYRFSTGPKSDCLPMMRWREAIIATLIVIVVAAVILALWFLRSS